MITSKISGLEALEIKDLDCYFAVFSDGACRGNPGPGAWASMGQNSKGEIIFESTGIEFGTTNNKMELQGAISGITEIVNYCKDNKLLSTENIFVFLYSDSKYLVDGVNSWIAGWKLRGWKKADNKTPENIEFWQTIDRLRENFKHLEFIWVKGHAGHPQNEHCDRLANNTLNEAGIP